MLKAEIPLESLCVWLSSSISHTNFPLAKYSANINEKCIILTLFIVTEDFTMTNNRHKCC